MQLNYENCCQTNTYQVSHTRPITPKFSQLPPAPTGNGWANRSHSCNYSWNNFWQISGPPICLPLFQSGCPSCLFLPLTCLCLPLQQCVYASPSMTITTVQSIRAALWLSWAQHFCLHGLFMYEKKKLQHILWLHWHRGKYNPGWTHNCTLIIIIFSFSPD